jgi:outer membrane immunogenic protein
MAARSRIVVGMAALAVSLGWMAGAEAADMALRGSMPASEAPSLDFGGAYIGGSFGIGSANLDVQTAGRNFVSRSLSGYTYETSTTQPAASSFIRLDPVRGTPRIFGAFVGYQAQYEDAVIGVEFDYTRVGAGGSSTFSMPTSGGGMIYNSTTTGYQIYRQNASVSATLHDYVTARLRAGWAYGRFMPYLTGGLAIARGTVTSSFDASLEDCTIDTSVTPNVTTCNGASTITSTISNNRNAIGFGFAMGTGVDVLVTNNVFLRAEYQYLRVPSIAGVAATLHTARVGVGIKY